MQNQSTDLHINLHAFCMQFSQPTGPPSSFSFSLTLGGQLLSGARPGWSSLWVGQAQAPVHFTCVLDACHACST